MSIYATFGSIQIEHPCSGFIWPPKYLRIMFQTVPQHIGCACKDCGYADGDPYSDFLPPVVNCKGEYARAVVAVLFEDGYNNKIGQKYITPLFTMPGEEFMKFNFVDLWTTLSASAKSLLEKGPK